MIEVRNLTKYYGSIRGVEDLSLKVPRGAVCGLIGPNGAGKTTTLKLLCCLLKPTSGEAWVAGVSIREELKVKKLVGYLPESQALYGFLTVREHIELAGRLHKLPRDELKAKAKALMEELKLEQLEDRRCSSLSLGQRRRVGLALALIGDPEVLLLDEPTSGLDPAQRASLLKLIKAMAEEGRTVLLSSHVLHEVSEACSMLAVLREGRLAYHGSLEEFRERYCPIVEVEAPGVEKLESEVKGMWWAKSVKAERGKLTVEASDLDAARVGLVKLLAAHSLPVRSLRSPGLEEAYLKLVGEEGAA